jgi:hypothetical protein
VSARGGIRSATRFALLALLLAAAPACRHDDSAVLVVVVTASGTPPSVVGLDVTLNGPGGPDSRRYERDGEAQIAFPTTLSAHLPAYATGALTITVRAYGAGNATVASGSGGPITVGVGERRTIYVQLDCGGDTCVLDGGAGDNDGGAPMQNPRCGNGRVYPGETCDTAIVAGAPGACPASCDDHVPCTIDKPKGSGCTFECDHEEEIRTPMPVRDGCCPTGTDSTVDPDCSPTCRNGVVDLGETCDLDIPRGTAGACPTDQECSPGAPCAKGMLVSGNTCSAVCVRYQIVKPLDEDSCCPPGATSAVDSDCPRLCGNGVVDQGESCDVGIPPLVKGACPTSCDDGKACTRDFMRPLGCQAACQHIPITAPLSGDGCCPEDEEGNPTATRATDTDCQPICGNGVVEPGETCDGESCPKACPPVPKLRADRAGCLFSKLVGDTETCSARCVVEEQVSCEPDPGGCCPPGCTAATDPDCSNRCGNSAIDTTLGEVCDTAAPQGDPSRCPLSCGDANVCTDDLLVSAGTCSAACMSLPTRATRPGDGCCPDIPAPGGGFQRANFLLDPDCTAVCGNGVVESPKERCDHAIPDSCPTDESCPMQLGCTRYVVQGIGYNCSATCVAMPISACVNGDGCCPATCSTADDSDCPAFCGNGVREDREICDRAITPGTPGACLKSCDDGIACTVDLASGSAEACTRTCIHHAITGCIADDGCCPQGCSAVNDRDCDPHCGDGRVGAGETCDPPSTCPTACADDGDACTDDRLIGDPAACSAACRHIPITACSGTVRDSCCPTGCTAENDHDCSGR